MSKFPLGFDPSEDDLEELEQYEEFEELDIGEEDARVLEQFNPSAPVQKMTLADIIMEKINEKQAAEVLKDDDGECCCDNAARLRLSS